MTRIEKGLLAICLLCVAAAILNFAMAGQTRPTTVESAAPTDAGGKSAAVQLDRASATASAVQDHVRAVARPAKVEFGIPTKMSLGETYVANLEIVREQMQPRFTGQNNVFTEQVAVLDRARAALESVDLKIERMSEEWQDVPPGTRGLWLWKVEPLKAGTAQLFVTLSHAATVDGVERRMLVDTFPRSVEIEVTVWQRMRLAATGLSGVFSGATGFLSGVATISGAVCSVLMWWRRRRVYRSVEPAAPQAPPAG